MTCHECGGRGLRAVAGDSRLTYDEAKSVLKVGIVQPEDLEWSTCPCGAPPAEPIAALQVGPYKPPPDACRACRERGKTWQGHNPKCAFTTGTFSPENWNCATMGFLRDAVEELGNVTHHEDEKFGVLGTDDGFLTLAWYKSRGRTDYAAIHADEPEPLTKERAERLVDEAAHRMTKVRR